MQCALLKATNYCYLPCGNTNHSSCNRCGVDPRCMGSQYIEYPLTDGDRLDILQAHNNLREKFATGRLHFSLQQITIADMNVINYHMELEHLAMCWCRRCLAKADPCPRTEKYPNVKQNLVVSTADWLWGCRYDLAIRSSMARWWAQFENLRFIISHCLHGDNCTGELSQVLWSKNTYVGCAMVKFQRGTTKCLLACNYAPGYTRGPLFKVGPAGLKCHRRAKNFNGLCGGIHRSGGTKHESRFAITFYLILYVLLKL